MLRISAKAAIGNLRLVALCAVWMGVMMPTVTAQSAPGSEQALVDQLSAKKDYFCYRSFWPELETTTKFAKIGVDTRCFFAANTINSAGFEYCKYPPIWNGIGKYDFSAYDKQVNDLVGANPNARFLCIIDLNTPYWLTRKLGVDSFVSVSHAAANADWLKYTKQWMADFIDYSEKQYGSKIDAYVLSGGGTSEWYEYDRGISSRMKNSAWRAWCERNGLQLGDSVPSETSLSKAAHENAIYDPVREMDKIQYWRFHNEIIATALLDFAKAAREKIAKPKEVGVFFGYYLVSDKKLTSFGHLDYERILASPDIDFLISPGTYADRQIGGGSGPQLIGGSVLRYGKRYLHEIDHSTHVSPQGAAWKTQAEDNAGLKREAAYALINHNSLWWFDMWGGRYTAESIDLVRRLREIHDKYGSDRSPSVAEALFIADPQSACYFNEKARQASAAARQFRDNLNKTGTPFDVYSFNDVSAIALSRYKVVFLPATVLITPERAEILKKYLCKDGRTLVWTYAPGISDGNTLDVSRVKQWTGSEYKTAGPATVDMGGWKAVYSYEYKTMTPAMLKRIMIEAGVHQYVDNDCPVYCNGRLLAIHTATGGSQTIHLPKPCRKVIDVFTGKVVAENVKDFSYPFQTPDTALLELDDR